MAGNAQNEFAACSAADPQETQTLPSWLGKYRPKTGWAAYNPLRPETSQRNRVFPITRLQRGQKAPVASELYPRLGIARHDGARALICDGSTLLAWVGVFHSAPLAPWQRAGLRVLIEPLRKRLRAERQLQHHAPTRAALDTLLETMTCAAFILTEGGAIEACNGPARTALRADRRSTLTALRAALQGQPRADGYSLTALEGGGAARWYLALCRASSTALPRTRATVAQHRFALTDRQSEVLESLLRGCSSLQITHALGISPSTLEKHVSALCERVGVRTRAALIARWRNSDASAKPRDSARSHGSTTRASSRGSSCHEQGSVVTSSASGCPERNMHASCEAGGMCASAP